MTGLELQISGEATGLATVPQPMPSNVENICLNDHILDTFLIPQNNTFSHAATANKENKRITWNDKDDDF